ncbi:unnamed protein product [Meloidogyne enterolobii]|uniref:Uncharacterized protein n=1 Tax=Meloidogyne enterolobii TaxID=390850 RepID=A0ACB0YCY7_MELEN
MNDLTDMGGKGFVWMCGKRRGGGGGRTVCVLVKVNGAIGVYMKEMEVVDEEG